MARAKKSPESDSTSPVGWGEIVSFGTLFLGVFGVLALGAILRTESPPARPSTPLSAPARTAVPSSLGGSPSRRDPSPVQMPEVSPDLVRRAESDLQRFMEDGLPWTLQLALLCDSAGVSQAVDRFGSHGAFHVLPSLHDDRACFVLSWNRYQTSEAAKAAKDLPDAIRSSYPGAFPKAVVEVLR